MDRLRDAAAKDSSASGVASSTGLGLSLAQENGTDKGAQMDREEATEEILEAKKEKGLTFEAIAQKVGRHKVWTTAALLGQHPMSAEEADAVVDLLGLSPEVGEALQEIPMRGSLDTDVPFPEYKAA